LAAYQALMNHDLAGRPRVPSTDNLAAPPPHPRPRNSPASSTERARSSNVPSREQGCVDCGGAGYYTLAVPVGHPQFARLIPCACLLRAWAEQAQAAQARQTSAVLAQLAQELGRLANVRFETFDPERSLVELTWADQTFSVSV
jgi:DNA replication protein DnaC